MISWMNSCAFSLTIPSSVSHIGLLDAPWAPAISSLFTHPLILARTVAGEEQARCGLLGTRDRGGLACCPSRGSADKRGHVLGVRQRRHADAADVFTRRRRPLRHERLLRGRERNGTYSSAQPSSEPSNAVDTRMRTADGLVFELGSLGPLWVPPSEVHEGGSAHGARVSEVQR